MEINIFQLIDGAKKAEGCTVIIDVFRAFTVEAYLINNGAEKVIPIGDKDIAYNLKKENKDILLIGERNGVKLDGFDYGNSPSQIENVDFTNKIIAHTTSAGTQGIVNATKATEILSGSFVNAKAISEYIKQKKFKKVSLVCMGLNAVKETEEDTLCARYIKDLISNNDTDYIYKELENLKYTSGKKFFKKENCNVFPEKDFFLSTTLNKFNFVLKLKKDSPYSYMEKIEIL